MSILFINDRRSTDPWMNLAIEECLLSQCCESDAILYLWQNASTVVIGRHQNPWRECRTGLLEREGGRLARRITGGGAVYHDMGNLNFSFIAGKRTYDTARHLQVVIDAVRSLGIPAEFSGRNDILSDGRKFSGNAFAHRQNASLHHGTLLASADLQKLGRYLQPPQAKMASKGIQSVQSRVVNLSELSPDATVEGLRQALADSFRHVYGPFAAEEAAALTEPAMLEELNTRQRSWSWQYGQTPQFDVCLENRFTWGGVEIRLTARDGLVTDAAVFSDAMDEAFISWLAAALPALPFSPAALAQPLKLLDRPEAHDLAQWLESCLF